MGVGWPLVIALGCLWLGAQVVVVAGLPRALRRGAVPRAEKGTPAAFVLFWMDQYSFIGLGLCAVAIALLVAGCV